MAETRESRPIVCYADPDIVVPDGYVLAPVILTPLAVSQIKDALEDEFGVHITQARPLWARLLEIAAGIPLAEQESMFVEARGCAPRRLSLEVDDG